MKYEIKISRLAVICVICATAASGAFGAASVRNLGGAGTYSGTSSAAAASGAPSGAINAVRAGSMRVTPTATRATTGTSGTTSGRAATSQRLSIGKYLGGGTSVSGGAPIKNQKPGVSVSSSGSATPGLSGDAETAFENKLLDIQSQIDKFNDSLADKQNRLTPVDNYIIIDEDDIYLDTKGLAKELENVMQFPDGGHDGREIEFSTKDDGLYWNYVGEAGDGERLIAWTELREKLGGISKDDVEQAVADVIDEKKLVTSAQMDTAIKNNNDTMNLAVAETIATALTDYYTKTEIDEKMVFQVVKDGTGIWLQYKDNAESKKKILSWGEAGGSGSVDEERVKELVKQALEDSGYVTSETLTDYVTKEALGALAYKSEITDADVADNAAIAKEKLADDVQKTLDNALTGDDAPTEGDWVLAVSDGQKNWFQVVTE